MVDAAGLTPRQIWAQPTSTTTTSYHPGCTPFLLPQHGYIHLNRTATFTLTQNAVFEPLCTGEPSNVTNPSAVLDTRDPFYSSVTPQLYAIGCATVVSYLLVIILLITPRTYYIGGPSGGANFLSRHGMIGGSYSGGSSTVGVGGRPWLQKVAAILVAISLTIASADSFKVAERQYIYGYSDAEALTAEVIDGNEIRIVRVISSTFLWLAQVQTLIRLFPRHKEKVMIKWAGFALIVLDTTFSILENFLVKTNTTRPRLYDDAIPALSYLFELSLNLLYAAWVIFYSLSKHRFAFFHPKMKNICLVALLSLCAVLIPVVFFVLDIAKPDVAGWGSYIRWVGSAAASVVVWEWVERIEALERDERKDGILGREIFDGDEMLEITPSEEVDWPRQTYNGKDRGGGTGASSGWGGMMGLAHHPLRTRNNGPRRQPGAQSQTYALFAESRRRRAARPTPPPVAVTPVSRADTNSAASTVYNVRYHPVSSPTPPVAMPYMEEEEETDGPKEQDIRQHNDHSDEALTAQQHQTVHTDPRWQSLLNPFRRRRASPPREVASAQAEHPEEEKESDFSEDEGNEQLPSAPRRDNHFFPFHRKRHPASGRQATDGSLPVTVIPARNQGQSNWSPQLFNDSGLLEQGRRPASNHPVSGHSNLPVRVIPSQTGIAPPWSTDDNANHYELRYDPEAAALVGPDDHLPDHLPGHLPANHRQDASQVSEGAGSDGTVYQPTPQRPGQERGRSFGHSAQDNSTTSEDISSYRRD